MKKTIMFPVVFLILIFFTPYLMAEVVYLKDGQVLTGTITKEDKNTITIETKYQVKRVQRANIQRILYGERYMEPIYMLLNDGTRVQGFLVDQDATKVIFRRDKDSPKEETILKENIKQLSNKKIIPLEPDVTLRAGIFLPLNKGGNSEYKLAPVYIIGTGINFPWLENIRVLFESGYTKTVAKGNESQFLRFIPINLYAAYILPFKYVNLISRLGSGAVVIDFDDGEGERTQGVDYDLVAGLEAEYEIIKRTLFAGLWAEYNAIIESGYVGHYIILTAGLTYRF